MLVGATAEIEMGGSPTRARTWDLRINSPWGAYVISLHHQLLTASAQLRHRSRMQCNAGACKTAQLHFRIHLKFIEPALGRCPAGRSPLVSAPGLGGIF